LHNGLGRRGTWLARDLVEPSAGLGLKVGEGVDEGELGALGADLDGSIAEDLADLEFVAGHERNLGDDFVALADLGGGVLVESDDGGPGGGLDAELTKIYRGGVDRR
jgi:hypothetical protein